MDVAVQMPTRNGQGFQPKQGLSIRHFKCLAHGGFGDGHNNYAHSMTWYEGKLYVGTTRSNLCMLRLQSAYKAAPFYTWPIECPETIDELDRFDRCAQIWCYDPAVEQWELAFRSPLVQGTVGLPVAREMGYRSMAVYQAASDPKPALYVAGWAQGRAPGGTILRSYDGRTFESVTRPGIFEDPVSATRSLTSFGDRMFFSPTARRAAAERTGAQANNAGLSLIFESRDPAAQNWTPVNEPGFGDPGNLGIFTLFADDDKLYAGTFNLAGYQVWVSDCQGTPPYQWRKLIDRGAGRGPLNQAVAAMGAFRGAVYVGSGIQGGGNDRVNKIGPAGAELIRLNPDGSWDLIVGDPRSVDGAQREPLSGLRAGFGNLFNGYVWTLASHDDWLYTGTFDWSVMLRWTNASEAPPKVVRFFDHLDPEFIVSHASGADLWRSRDGENWMPVTRQGFGNPYNAGIRNLVSTPHGLFAGTANFFGPRVAVRHGSEWAYEDNARGGLEVWLGSDGAAA